DEYLVGLRERYKNDEIASRYLDNLFACIASAVRAFSVEQDMFRTRWQGIAEIRKTEIERAKRIEGYSPFTEGNYWNKVLAILAAVGITLPTMKTILEESGITSMLFQVPAYLGGLIVVFTIVLFWGDWLIFRYKIYRLAKIEKLYPMDIENVWRERSMSRYEVILRDFLLSALILRETYYPSVPCLGNQRILETYSIPGINPPVTLQVSGELKSLEELYPILDKIIKRHMSLRS
ncbi:MAG TPA: hypothetical protein VGQ60_03660, partial [Nitrospiraceae bacterium]|nr:hypothetical protein [Nitrospiraceae bacterium]